MNGQTQVTLTKTNSRSNFWSSD